MNISHELLRATNAYYAGQLSFTALGYIVASYSGGEHPLKSTLLVPRRTFNEVLGWIASDTEWVVDSGLPAPIISSVAVSEFAKANPEQPKQHATAAPQNNATPDTFSDPAVDSGNQLQVNSSPAQ
jgi:hypothetical protein